MSVSINDELQNLKKVLKDHGYSIFKIEKIANGNTAFFKMDYCRPQSITQRSFYFNRHDIDKIIADITTK